MKLAEAPALRESSTSEEVKRWFKIACPPAEYDQVKGLFPGDAYPTGIELRRALRPTETDAAPPPRNLTEFVVRVWLKSGQPSAFPAFLVCRREPSRLTLSYGAVALDAAQASWQKLLEKCLDMKVDKDPKKELKEMLRAQCENDILHLELAFQVQEQWRTSVEMKEANEAAARYHKLWADEKFLPDASVASPSRPALEMLVNSCSPRGFSPSSSSSSCFTILLLLVLLFSFLWPSFLLSLMQAHAVSRLEPEMTEASVTASILAHVYDHYWPLHSLLGLSNSLAKMATTATEREALLQFLQSSCSDRNAEDQALAPPLQSPNPPRPDFRLLCGLLGLQVVAMVLR